MTAASPRDLPVLETDVLVVGAGPTGLMGALVLARRGLRAELIDAKSAPTRESRALVVHARTMEIYDQLGLAPAVLAEATAVTRLQLGRAAAPRRLEIAAAQTGWTAFPGVRILEQSRTEEILSSTLAAEGRPVRWRHRLLELRAGGSEADDHVDALVEGPEGPLRIRARWCLGADGASSTVRRRLGLPFEGVTDEATFCVADLHGVTGLPDHTLVARVGRMTFALVIPLGPGGHRRLIWLSPTDAPDPQEVLAQAQADLGLDVAGVDWFSAYRVHHRVAARFRRGATFLAGDAAHVHSPLGGQGMNTGLQDAHHLAHLLADVAQEHRAPEALERYEAERRPVALTLVRVTDRAFGLLARRSRVVAQARRRGSAVLAHLAPRVLASPLGPRLAGYLGQYRIRYRFLPAGEPAPLWADDPAVGLRLPPVDANAEALRTLGWQLHTYGAEAARPRVPGWISGPHAFAPDPRGRLREDRLYLVRPDGYVAASLPVHAGATATADVRAALAAHHLIG